MVVPARDEEERVGACIAALAAQEGVAAAEYEVLLVLDACRDDTAGRARDAARRAPGLRLHVLRGGGAPAPARRGGAGWTRRGGASRRSGARTA